MARFEYDLAILGGGAAGLTVASGASQLGAKTVLVERERSLGGDCLHYGCVPSKTLIQSSRVYHALKNTSVYGLPPISPGPVDFSLVGERIRSVIDTIQQHDSVERFNRLGVEVVFGNGRFSDEHSLEVAGRRINARKWLIATGSSPAVPELPGLAEVGYLTNRDIFSLKELPESLTVIGGGAIAMEMAQAFRRLGSRVTVLQRSGQILSREDKDMADLVMEAMKAEGVVFCLGCRLLAARRLGDEKEILFTDREGVEKSVCSGDILVALGRSVNVHGFDLENTGVEFSRRGIAVDSRMRTSRKHIFAAGDVVGSYQFTHAAGYEGGIVLSNAILHFPKKTDYTWMPWCTYTSPELASIGLNEKRAQEAGIAYSVHTEHFSDNDRATAEGATTGKVKLLVNRKGKPLGVQICGEHAGDLLAEWVALFNGGVKLSTLAGAVHPYPTRAEINKRVAGSIYAPKLFSDRVRAALKYIFRYQGRAVK